MFCAAKCLSSAPAVSGRGEKILAVVLCFSWPQCYLISNVLKLAVWSISERIGLCFLYVVFIQETNRPTYSGVAAANPPLEMHASALEGRYRFCAWNRRIVGRTSYDYEQCMSIHGHRTAPAIFVSCFAAVDMDDTCDSFFY